MTPTNPEGVTGAPVAAPVLLPCPFCGCEAKLVNTYPLGQPCPCVRCTNCGCESSGHNRIEEADAIKCWNTRAASSAPVIQEVLADRSDADALIDLYRELLFAVARKFPGESRHETALRYIRQAEERANDSGAAKAAIGAASQGGAK